jgi:hypothetical protein
LAHSWRKAGGREVSLTGEQCQSSHDERYDSVDSAAAFAVAGHQFNDGPFLPKQSRRLLHIQGVYFDATRPPSTIVRDLKEEGVANRFPIAIERRSFLSHSVSPWCCGEVPHIAFSILIFVRRDCDAEKFWRVVANI